MRTLRWLTSLAVGGWLTVAGVGAAVAQSESGDRLPDPSEAEEIVSDEETSEESATSAEPERTESSGRAESEGDRSESGDDEAATDETSGDASEDGDWRVEEDDGPPVQVRRAVDQIQTKAQAVAGSIADDGSGEKPEIRRLDRKAGEDSDEAMADEDGGSTETFFDSLSDLIRGDSGETLDLDPYVDDPRWKKAMRQLVDDKCRRALDKVDTVLEESDRNLRSIPAVRYAVARVKMCAGKAKEGRQTLKELAKRDDAVGRIAGRRLGRKPEPIEADGESAGWLVKLKRAREIAGEGELDRALEMLDELEDRVDPGWSFYKVEMTEAKLLLRHGRTEEAGRELFGLYRTARDWQVGGDLESRIETIEQRHDLDILTLGSRVDRMRELISQRDFGLAEDVSTRNAKLAGVSGSEINGWGAYRRALVAEEKRDRERAVELFKKAERLVDSSVIRPRLYFGWARAERRLDDNARAIELYQRLCREYPRQHLCDDARFEIGRLNQYSGNHEKARAAFVELLATHPKSEHVADALWRGALSTYLMGEYNKVDRPLQTLIERFPEETDASGLRVALKAKYWLGMAAAQRGEKSLAKRRFQRTINTGALTWYGRLAARRVRQLGADPVVPEPPKKVSPKEIHNLATLELPAHDRYRVAAVYSRLQLYSDALSEIERQLEVKPLPDKARQFHASLELAAGNRAAAHWLMEKQLESPAPTRDTLHKWGVAYPMEFREAARQYATKYDVSPYLVQAVMREESGFRAEVSSGVGAVGLMQLMPGSANVIQKNHFDGSRVSRSELREPKTNVRLGTAYLRVLLSWAKNRMPMVLAGYNAGPAPVKDWFKRFDNRKMDAWVELMTYRQARAYVRKVYTSYVRYKALYGGKLPSVHLTLPSGFNRWGEAPQLRDESSAEAVSMAEGR